MEKVTGRAEVIIGKQRHGPTGTVALSFEAQFTRFGNLAHDSYMPSAWNDAAPAVATVGAGSRSTLRRFRRMDPRSTR